MHKLKNSYIDKMIMEKASRKEIAFILYVARFQDDCGTIYSAYYKDVCKAIRTSAQKFYDILESLSSKGLISYEKVNPVDFVIRLIGNDFSDSDFSCGYVNVESKDFLGTIFSSLKAGAQLIYLYTLRFTKGKHLLLKNFYESFCGLLGVEKKTLVGYMHQLKSSKLIFVKKKKNASGNYEMNINHGNGIDITPANRPREKDGLLKNIGDLVHLNFGRDLPKDCKQIDDVVGLADTKRAEKQKGFVSILVSAIKESFDIQRDEGKKPRLNAALVNKRLTKLIKNLEERGELRRDTDKPKKYEPKTSKTRFASYDQRDYDTDEFREFERGLLRLEDNQKFESEEDLDEFERRLLAS